MALPLQTSTTFASSNFRFCMSCGILIFVYISLDMMCYHLFPSCFGFFWQKFNPMWPNDIIDLGHIWPLTCLLGTRPLPETMLTYCQIYLRNKFKWNFNQNMNIFSQENLKKMLAWSQCVNQYMYHITWHVIRADSRFAPSQWEKALLSNSVSHWLGASLESALCYDFYLVSFLSEVLYQ